MGERLDFNNFYVTLQVGGRRGGRRVLLSVAHLADCLRFVEAVKSRQQGSLCVLYMRRLIRRRPRHAPGTTSSPSGTWRLASLSDPPGRLDTSILRQLCPHINPFFINITKIKKIKTPSLSSPKIQATEKGGLPRKQTYVAASTK